MEEILGKLWVPLMAVSLLSGIGWLLLFFTRGMGQPQPEDEEPARVVRDRSAPAFSMPGRSTERVDEKDIVRTVFVSPADLPAPAPPPQEMTVPVPRPVPVAPVAQPVRPEPAPDEVTAEVDMSPSWASKEVPDSVIVPPRFGNIQTPIPTPPPFPRPVIAPPPGTNPAYIPAEFRHLAEGRPANGPPGPGPAPAPPPGPAAPGRVVAGPTRPIPAQGFNGSPPPSQPYSPPNAGPPMRLATPQPGGPRGPGSTPPPPPTGFNEAETIVRLDIPPKAPARPPEPPLEPPRPTTPYPTPNLAGLQRPGPPRPPAPQPAGAGPAQFARMGANIVVQTPMQPVQQGITLLPHRLEVIYGNFSPVDPKEIPFYYAGAQPEPCRVLFSSAPGESIWHVQLNHFSVYPDLHADIVCAAGKCNLTNKVKRGQEERFQTRVNGAVLMEGESRVLTPGDIISLGIYRLRFS